VPSERRSGRVRNRPAAVVETASAEVDQVAWRELAKASDYGVFGGPAVVRALASRRLCGESNVLWSNDAAVAIRRRPIGTWARVVLPAAHSGPLGGTRGPLDRSTFLGSSAGQRRLAEHLVERCGPRELLAFPLIADGSTTGAALWEAASAAGMVTAWVSQAQEHVVQRSDQWPYFGTPSAHRRRRLRRIVRAASNIRVEFAAPIDRAETERLIDIAASVEAVSWKATAGTAKLIGRNSVLYRRLLVEAAADGNLVVAMAREGSTPIGCLLGFQSDHTFACYLGAYADSHRAVAPGLLLYLGLFEHLANTPVLECSFLRGNEAYKASFGSDRRALGLFLAGRTSALMRRLLLLEVAIPAKVEAARAALGRLVLAGTGRNGAAWRQYAGNRRVSR